MAETRPSICESGMLGPPSFSQASFCACRQPLSRASSEFLPVTSTSMPRTSISSLVATGMMPRSPPTWATSPAPAAKSAIATAIRTHGRRAVGVLGRARLGIGEIGGLLPNGEWKSKRERIKRSAMSANDSYTYAKAGVSIDAGNALVKAIGPLVKATRRPGADAEIGGFGGFFDPKAAGYAD